MIRLFHELVHKAFFHCPETKNLHVRQLFIFKLELKTSPSSFKIFSQQENRYFDQTIDSIASEKPDSFFI